MKNKGIIRAIIQLLLILSIVMFSSCQHYTDEANAKVTLSNTIVYGQVKGSAPVSASVTLSLEDTSFQSFGTAGSTTSLSTWIKNLPSGVNASVSGIVPLHAKSITINFSGTPMESCKNYLIVDIPASYLSNRMSNLREEGPAKFDIRTEKDRYAYMSVYSGNMSLTTGADGSTATADYFINLDGGVTFTKDFKAGEDVTEWFTPSIKGLTLKVVADTKAPTTTLKVRATLEAKDTCSTAMKMSATIPNGYVSGGALMVNPNGFTVTPYKYFVDVTIAKSDADKYIVGKVGEEIKPFEISVLLKGIKPNTTAVTFGGLEAGADLSSWFGSTAIDGLTYTLKEKVYGTNDYINIVVAGTPEESAFRDIALTIPRIYLLYDGNQTVIANDVEVPSNGVKYEIAKNDKYAWALYDLASFGEIEVLTESPNKNMTKNANGEDLTFGEKNVLASGDTQDVVFAPGLSRRGYKLKGFAKKVNGSVDPNKVVYTGDITTGFKLNSDDCGSLAKLYAVWEQDETSPYFKEAFKFTITKSEIDAANPASDDTTGLKELSDLKYHDGTTALPSDYKQEFSFIALPGGKIGGTEENPEYFKWPVSWTSSNNPTTVADIKEDFAISDITLTPALFNVVYKWATDNARGTDVYKFNLDTSSPLLAGISYVNNTSTSRHSAEDPLVRMNWYQSVIFANALTEWYNDVHKSDEGFVALTPAYLNTDGSVLRDASVTDILDKINPEQNPTAGKATGIKHTGTGFRLPTRAEWQYAASVLSSEVPEGWNTTGSVSYPWAQSYAYTSGVNEVATSTPTDAVKAVAVYDYYSRLLASEYGTQAVGKYFKADSIRTAGAIPNKLGVYDMSGNVWEWAEDWYSSSHRCLSGGSWYTSAVYLYVGYTSYTTPAPLSDYCGIRFCMTISPSNN